MEALILSLRGRLVGLPGDRFDAEPGDVVDELADDPAPGRVRLFGAARATPASRNIRDSDTVDGAGIPIAAIFAWTLIGP